MKLKHYGSDKFIASDFQPIENRQGRSKPRGGLWTSPSDSKWGWRDWCESEDWGDLSVSFELFFTGTLFMVDSVFDMLALPWIDDDTISFQSMLSEYDGIHLTVKGQEETRFTCPKSLYGWDCETVLIFNQETFQP